MLFNANDILAEENNKYKIVKKSLITGDVTTEVVPPSKAKNWRPTTPAYIPEELKSNDIWQDIELYASSSRNYVKPSKFPYTAIGQLSATFKISNGSTQTVPCTAFLEGPDVLFTAAHCVYDASFGGWADTIVFYPARDGSSKPYSANVSEMSIAQSYVDEQKDDWSILVVDKDLGDLGWFGKGTVSDALLNKNMRSSGYDSDKNGQQWESQGIVKRIGDNYGEDNVIMDLSGIFAIGGHSGSPVFDNEGTVWSSITFGGGPYGAGGRAIDDWIYDMLQEEYIKSINRYSRYSHLR